MSGSKPLKKRPKVTKTGPEQGDDEGKSSELVVESPPLPAASSPASSRPAAMIPTALAVAAHSSKSSNNSRSSSFAKKGEGTSSSSHPAKLSGMEQIRSLSLVQVEIDGQLDDNRKQAFVAAPKALVEHESAVLRYLRTHNFAAPEAAVHLLQYWEQRRQLLGPDRAYWPLTRSEQDGPCVLSHLNELEQQVLMSGFLTILPKNVVGEVVLCLDPDRLRPALEVAGMAICRCVRVCALIVGTLASMDDAAQLVGVHVLHVLSSHQVAQGVAGGASTAVLEVAAHLPLKLSALHCCIAGGDDQEKCVAFAHQQSTSLETLLHSADTPEEMAAQLAEYGLQSPGLPDSLGGQWSYEHHTALLASCTPTRAADHESADHGNDAPHLPQQQHQPRHAQHAVDEALLGTTVSIGSASDNVHNACPPNKKNMSASLQSLSRLGLPKDDLEDESSAPGSPTAAGHGDSGNGGGAVLLDRLAEAADMARVEDRKSRKRRLDAMYARKRRSREKAEEEVLQGRIIDLSKRNMDLDDDNKRLETLLAEARALVGESSGVEQVNRDAVKLSSRRPTGTEAALSAASYVPVAPKVAAAITAHADDLSASSLQTGEDLQNIGELLEKERALRERLMSVLQTPNGPAGAAAAPIATPALPNLMAATAAPATNSRMNKATPDQISSILALLGQTAADHQLIFTTPAGVPAVTAGSGGNAASWDRMLAQIFNSNRAAVVASVMQAMQQQQQQPSNGAHIANLQGLLPSMGTAGAMQMSGSQTARQAASLAMAPSFPAAATAFTMSAAQSSLHPDNSMMQSLLDGKPLEATTSGHHSRAPSALTGGTTVVQRPPVQHIASSSFASSTPAPHPTNDAAEAAVTGHGLLQLLSSLYSGRR